MGKVLCVQLVYRVLTQVSGAASLSIPFRGVEVLGAAPAPRGSEGETLGSCSGQSLSLWLVTSRANSSANVLFLRKGFGLDMSSADCLVKEFSLSSE